MEFCQSGKVETLLKVFQNCKWSKILPILRMQRYKWVQGYKCKGTSMHDWYKMVQVCARRCKWSLEGACTHWLLCPALPLALKPLYPLMFMPLLYPNVFPLNTRTWEDNGMISICLPYWNPLSVLYTGMVVLGGHEWKQKCECKYKVPDKYPAPCTEPLYISVWNVLSNCLIFNLLAPLAQWEVWVQRHKDALGYKTDVL